MEHIPSDIDFVEIQFIAEHLLGLYALVAKYGGVVVLYSSGDNVYRAYVPTEEEFRDFLAEKINEIEWADYEKLKKDIERIKQMLGEESEV